MLGFGAMGQWALGQVPIDPAYGPGVFVGDVAAFVRRQEKDTRAERDKAWQEEGDAKAARRLQIAGAVFGESAPILWTGRPAKAAVTPQTMGLTQDIFTARTKIRTLNEIAEEEEMERQLEKLLLDL